MRETARYGRCAIVALLLLGLGARPVAAQKSSGPPAGTLMIDGGATNTHEEIEQTVSAIRELLEERLSR